MICILFLEACNQGPQPISYGKDDCAACKMTIIDKKFGAEIISIKGKVFKFDDIICMIEFLNSGIITENQISKKLVIDFQNENSFIEVEQATFYVSNELHSPMNGNAAAFINKEAAIKYQDGKQGLIMDWNQVYNKLK
jgi:copper chaperone NosL